MLALGLSVNACRTDAIRYQTDAHLLLFVLVGALILITSSARIRVGLATAEGALLLISSSRALAAIHEPSFQTAAYLLVKEAASRLPTDVTIRIPPAHLDGAPIGDFPDYLLMEQGHRVFVDLDANPADPATCFVWIGPRCYSFAWNDEVDPLSRATPVEDAALRADCLPVASWIDTQQRPIVARRLSVPLADQEYLRVPGHPLVGLFPCAPRPTQRRPEQLFPDVQ